MHQVSDLIGLWFILSDNLLLVLLFSLLNIINYINTLIKIRKIFFNLFLEPLSFKFTVFFEIFAFFYYFICFILRILILFAFHQIFSENFRILNLRIFQILGLFLSLIIKIFSKCFCARRCCIWLIFALWRWTFQFISKFNIHFSYYSFGSLIIVLYDFLCYFICICSKLRLFLVP